MLSLRNTALLFVILLASLSTLTACGASAPQQQQHLLSTIDIVRKVGAYYGDPHAQIKGVKSTETDNPPHDPMYIMGVVGNCHKGILKAHSLSFSALTMRMYV